MKTKEHYDVAIVGGSVAGCIAALCFARHGLRVAVLERKRSIDNYKTLCTHLIQPVALPILRKLGLDRIIEAHGAVRTKAAFWPRVGWIDPSGDYGDNPDTAFAYNIERRVLDPIFRKQLLACDEIELHMGHGVTEIPKTDDGWELKAETQGVASSSIFARMVVAADGRQSRIARLLSNSAVSNDNQRAAYFGYFKGVSAPRNNRSLFLLDDKEMGFVYPLEGGCTLLSAYVTKEQAMAWRGLNHLDTKLVGLFRMFPDLSDLSSIRCISRVFGYVDYPNLTRKPVCRQVPFIGDAALSLDPMSGIGCGFAMVAANMLTEATWEALKNHYDLTDSLARYEASFNDFFLPHAQGIKADLVIAKSAESIRQMYRPIVENHKLQQDFIALTGRIISPKKFQRAYLFAAAQTKRRNEHSGQLSRI